MSLKFEQYNSMKQTKEFLYLLLTPQRPKKASEIKEKARRCLRHYPPLTDKGKPIFSQDDFAL